MLSNTASRYGAVSIGLHWVMALAIFAMFGLGLWMTQLDYYDAWYHRAPELHKAAGMLLLFLLLFRLVWRLGNTRPALMGLCREKVIALIVHRMHYVLMFILTLSGYLIPTTEGKGIDVFGWFTVPALLEFDKHRADLIGLLHLGAAWALMGLVVVHSAAALKHHFVDRDATLTRMLGNSSQTKENDKEITS